MKTEPVSLSVPAALYGEASERAFLFVHGLGGNKEEAADFAALVPEYQVLSIDLAGHGARTDAERLNPWCAVPELREALDYAKSRFSDISLRATSLGAWFSLMAFTAERLTQAQLVSPICDMEHLIAGKMLLARVSEQQLAQQREIALPDGTALSWEYLSWVRAHPLTRWDTPTDILCGEFDNVVSYSTLTAFSARFGGSVSVVPDGEHWLHTPPDLAYLARWTRQKLDAHAHNMI